MSIQNDSKLTSSNISDEIEEGELPSEYTLKSPKSSRKPNKTKSDNNDSSDSSILSDDDDDDDNKVGNIWWKRKKIKTSNDFKNYDDDYDFELIGHQEFDYLSNNTGKLPTQQNENNPKSHSLAQEHDLSPAKKHKKKSLPNNTGEELYITDKKNNLKIIKSNQPIKAEKIDRPSKPNIPPVSFPCKFFITFGKCEEPNCSSIHKPFDNDFNLRAFIRDNEEFYNDIYQRQHQLAILPKILAILQEKNGILCGNQLNPPPQYRPSPPINTFSCIPNKIFPTQLPKYPPHPSSFPNNFTTSSPYPMNPPHINQQATNHHSYVQLPNLPLATSNNTNSYHMNLQVNILGSETGVIPTNSHTNTNTNNNIRQPHFMPTTPGYMNNNRVMPMNINTIPPSNVHHAVYSTQVMLADVNGTMPTHHQNFRPNPPNQSENIVPVESSSYNGGGGMQDHPKNHYNMYKPNKVWPATEVDTIPQKANDDKIEKYSDKEDNRKVQNDKLSGIIKLLETKIPSNTIANNVSSKNSNINTNTNSTSNSNSNLDQSTKPNQNNVQSLKPENKILDIDKIHNKMLSLGVLNQKTKEEPLSQNIDHESDQDKHEVDTAKTEKIIKKIQNSLPHPEGDMKCLLNMYFKITKDPRIKNNANASRINDNSGHFA